MSNHGLQQMVAVVTARAGHGPRQPRPLLKPERYKGRGGGQAVRKIFDPVLVWICCSGRGDSAARDTVTSRLSLTR